MNAADSNLSITKVSPMGAYILISLFLSFALLAFALNFYITPGCKQYLGLVQYSPGITSDTCFSFYFWKGFIASITEALPFFFLGGTLIYKEKNKNYQIQSRKEKITFWLLGSTLIIFLFYLILLMRVPHCSDAECLIWVILTLPIYFIFPPLIFVFALWFLKTRYQWRKWEFGLIQTGTILLLLLPIVL